MNSRPIYQPKTITLRNYNFLNNDNFSRDLQLVPFHHIFLLYNVDDKLNFLNNCILSLFDTHAPLVTRRFTKPAAPWLTDNLRFLMDLRDKAKARYRRSKLPEH